MVDQGGEMEGTVSNVIDAKKFGFIAASNGLEYFFHMEDLVGNWDDLASDFVQFGAGKIQVDFTADKTPKGPRARNVARIGG